MSDVGDEAGQGMVDAIAHSLNEDARDVLRDVSRRLQAAIGGASRTPTGEAIKQLTFETAHHASLASKALNDIGIENAQAGASIVLKEKDLDRAAKRITKAIESGKVDADPIKPLVNEHDIENDAARPATEKQRAYIKSLYEGHLISRGVFERRDALTTKEADAEIKRARALEKARAERPRVREKGEEARSAVEALSKEAGNIARSPIRQKSIPVR